MANQTAEARKSCLIDTLINHGIYKKNNVHLFQLTLLELEDEYANIFGKSAE
ncbi:Fur-regulated basic protein FbpA [Actinomycetes bacterium NPDC127524]|uniref:Fur-regulated basic protein FbpA n=1 Tax=unclassified Bacillus (in: firmicutes) TaxID=185979 RepID=UPI0008E94874|nr:MULTISPECIES: Fur-regulated basic protein FbpA [unclassified Bacillus (in: firmicutes)]SFC80652.1 Fur-regulated basic protein A [Bacillus sp. OV322]